MRKAKLMDDLLPAEIMQKAQRGISYIAHPLRLRILEFLDVCGSSAVSDIANNLQEDQTIVSQSLKKLREANLVKTKRRGIFIYYDIREEYPASIFVCIRKLFGYMTDNFRFLRDDYKAILPKDYTTMVANRIKLFSHLEKMRIIEYLSVFGRSNVSDIAKGLKLEPLKVTQFLQKLREDEFVSCQKEGRFVFYNLTKGVHQTAIGCIRKRYASLPDKTAF